MGLFGCLPENDSSSGIELEFLELNVGGGNIFGTYTRKQSIIIASQEEYNNELAKHTDQKPTIADYSIGKTLYIDMGPRNSGGYSIVVNKVLGFDEYVVAEVTLSKPGKDCIVTQAFTNPYQFVFIKTQKDILLNEKIVSMDCRQ